MTTFEILDSNKEQRNKLRESGFKLEYLEPRYWNVMCDEEITDDLVELLEEMKLAHRSI